MLDMITFWVAYGVLMVCWFGFPVYWSFNLVDWWLNNITGGDMKYYLQDKIRNPFLDKLGLMEEKSYRNYLTFKDDGLLGIITIVPTVVGGIVAAAVILVTSIEEKGHSLHTFTVFLSEFATEHLSLPILIIFILVVMNGLLKKLYKFGKKAKTAIDKLDNQ